MKSIPLPLACAVVLIGYSRGEGYLTKEGEGEG